MSYQPKVAAYPHQVEALAKLGGQPNAAYLMAMRTGKTKVLLDDFGQLEYDKKVQDLLVIAPGGVYRTWVKAIEDHCSDDLRSRLKVHVWQSGMSKTASIGLNQFIQTDNAPRCLLMNVEALSRPGEGRETAIKFLSQRNTSMLAIDESTIIKNQSAKRTKFINKNLAPLAQYRRILSGLATPRSPMDLFSQFEFLDWRILNHRSFFTFRNRYAILKPMNFGGRMVQIIDGYKNEDELRELIEPHSFRVEFRPNIPSTYTIREVELTPEQRKAYDEIKEFATTKLANQAHVSATVVIAQLLRMHQVLCGWVGDEQKVLQELPELRTKELLELLSDYAGKAIIWCSYDINVRKVFEALIEEYGAGSVARFWGGNTETREDEEAQFLTSPACRFIVATPDSGGKGRTWSNADLVVYYSSRNNLEHRDQSEQRAQGYAKDRAVDYVDLIVPGSVEVKILEALRAKKDMASLINGDNYQSWII